jgi:NAD(P)-dependent dehydrogenase (short-subunit alcohol dehydrogenase family)
MPTAVITGAASGMGLVTAARLVAEGWNVHGWDLSPGVPEGVRWVAVDVSDIDQVRKAATDVPSCDLLFNAAGIAPNGLAAEMSAEQWAKVIAVDLNGTFFCCQALFPALASSKGVVINVASTRAYRPAPGRSAYAAAKAGVVMLTQSLGLEWAADGVRVIAIAPGYVRTPLVQALLDNGGLRADVILERTPLGRMAEPEEIAELVLALTGPAFSFMTATTLTFDGGWLANDSL